MPKAHAIVGRTGEGVWTLSKDNYSVRVVQDDGKYKDVPLESEVHDLGSTSEFRVLFPVSRQSGKPLMVAPLNSDWAYDAVNAGANNIQILAAKGARPQALVEVWEISHGLLTLKFGPHKAAREAKGIKALAAAIRADTSITEAEQNAKIAALLLQ